MSNNLVSQQLSILNGDMGQLEPAYVNVDSSVLNMRMGMMGPMSTDAATHQFPISNQQMHLVDQMSYIPGSQNLTVSNKHLGNMEPTLDNMGSQKLLPIQKDRETEASLNNLGSQKLLYPNKRKAVVEPMFNNSVQQQISMPNKRAAHMEPHLSSPGSLHHSATNKKAMHLQSLSSASGSQNSPAPNKKMVRNESISNKSGTQRVQTPKGRTVQMEAPRKIQSESFESVRSKMRESLAAALALVRQNQNKTPKQEKSSPHKVDITPSQTSEDSKLAESTSTPVDAAGIPENMHAKGSCSADKPSDGQNSFAEASTHEGVVNSPHTWKSSGQDSLYNTVLPDGDVSFTDNFFVKDELLQGNGLSWAWDMVIEAVEPKEVQAAKHVDVGEDGDERKVRSPECLTFKNEAEEGQAAKHVDASGDGGEKNLQSPENLAFKIEVELFKLFGGVNKKYKEKGRSLMFNLKDRNNPELRERVMSGEISPEKLCSMTAEELASKELSEWRMAKAEELAQMIVLPDSDGDRRRLVKKTHKGEYQVEVEQDDSVSVEVSVGTTTFTQILPKDKETVAPSSSENEDVKDTKNVESEKGSLDNQDSCSLTIPADGTDLMQGLIEDEFKDAEFLPPIVSLDEFMESLNSEPPFDNLAVDAGQTKPSSEKVKSETGDKVVASNPASKDPGDTKLGKATKIDTKIKELELDVKSSDHPVEQKHSTPDKTSMAEHVWEGALQLQISASVTVIGLFRSGEKTSTKEWASSLEIKGRVRLDAFEKFLQELPMSRSRAVMVVHFVLKPGSSEDDRASLREVIDSYVLDERLGFAEPTAGMELYLSPPHPKILEMLGKHLSKDQTEIIKSTDNGLIGVVVWRRAHISSTISPNSTSHHKHSSKKQQHLMSRRQEKDTNVNVNMTSRTPIPFGQPPIRSGPTPNNDLDDDDIPPGFGPGAARDDDDLPEFNFSGNSTSSVPGRVSSQPSRLTSFNPHQMRELIQKYGQTGHSDNSPRTWQDKGGVGHGIQAWNNDDDDNDDDDDIPEWRPDVPQQQIPAPSLTVHSFHQPMHPHMVNQPLGSSAPHHLMSQQIGVQPVAMPPTNMNINPSWQQGGRWARPQGFQPGSLGSQLNVGQLYGTSSVPRVGQQPGNWRQDAPRSRGF